MSPYLADNNNVFLRQAVPTVMMYDRPLYRKHMTSHKYPVGLYLSLIIQITKHQPRVRARYIMSLLKLYN